MRITSFDELQREITKLSDAISADGGMVPATSNALSHLVAIDRLDDLSRSAGQLWMSTIGDLGAGAMAERYGRRIRALEQTINRRRMQVIARLEIVAQNKATKKKLQIPDWYGEMTARMCYSSIRGYWMYALNPLSIIGQTPTYDLYYKIDIFGVKMHSYAEWPKPLGYIPSQETLFQEKMLDPDNYAQALQKSFDNVGGSGQYCYHTNMSMWVDMQTKLNPYYTERKDYYRGGLSRGASNGSWQTPTSPFRVSQTSIEARLPNVTFTHNYDLRNLFNSLKIVMK